jgi:SpoVK/Ycf46/Vps4 family AAA+-type ATPase
MPNVALRPAVQAALERLLRQVQTPLQGVHALFVGPRGAEKDQAAQWLAQHLGVKLLRVDLARVVSKYAGETEKNIQALFDAAHAGGALLYFDEADALFGKRERTQVAEDRHASIDVNFMLQRIAAYQGVLIIAIYRQDDIDPALLRRVTDVVEFGDDKDL